MNKEFTVQVIYLRSRRMTRNLFKEVPPPERSSQDEKTAEVRWADAEKLLPRLGNPSASGEKI